MLYFISTFLGVLGAWTIGRFGDRLGLVDHPNERSSHRISTPKGGGIGILAAFISASVWIGIPLALWISTCLVSLFSLYGDKQELSPKLRLLVQFACAFIFFLGAKSHELASLRGLLFISLASIFMVGTANFYNFMDGINGIAGITGGIGFGLIALFAGISGSVPSSIILAGCISLSNLGFLPFNIPRAKVFMGDGGSVLLGFLFAGMVVWLSKTFSDFVCLAAFLFPFYADELTTMAVRIRDGEDLSKAHRRHLYQLLANEFRIPHWKVSLGYGFIQLFVGVTILFIKPISTMAVMSLLILYFCVFINATWSFRKKLVYES